MHYNKCKEVSKMAQVSLSTRIQHETYELLQKTAAETGLSIAKIVDDAINARIGKEEKK